MLRLRRALTVIFTAGLVLSFNQGCDNSASSTGEVQRTPEFQEAAQNSKYAMMDHMKPKKPDKKSRNHKDK